MSTPTKRAETEAEKTARLRALRLSRDAASRSAPLSPASSSSPRFRGKVWDLEDELTFGKHQGQTISYVIEEDRAYLVWALEEIGNFMLSDEAQREFDAAADPREPPRAWRSPRYDTKK